jgi:hypothetical protein
MKRNYVVLIRWMVIYDYEVPGGALNYPDRGHLQGKIPMVEPVIEPGT